jgi:hypothetical protein
MWMLVGQAIVSLIISYALTTLLAPKPQTPTAGALDIPEPQPGALLGVSFGTNVFKSANVIWLGDADTTPIRASGGK